MAAKARSLARSWATASRKLNTQRGERNLSSFFFFFFVVQFAAQLAGVHPEKPNGKSVFKIFIEICRNICYNIFIRKVFILKYCLDARCNSKTLEKVDEIRVQERDIGILTETLEKYPNATIVFEVNGQEDTDFQFLEAANEMNNNRLKIASRVLFLDYVEEFKKRNLPFFYDFPVSSYFELTGLQDLGVCEILIGMPLFFDLDRVKRFNIPVRAVANKAYDRYIPRKNGICGQWIRPEDVDIYERYINVIEFSYDTYAQAETLYHIYAENKNWPDDLNILIRDLNCPAGNDNRLVPREKLFPARLNCRQRCQWTSCHICETALNYRHVVEQYQRNLEEKEL